MSEYGMEAEFENKEVREFIKNISDRLKNIKDGKKEYFGLISGLVVQDINQHFEKESGPDEKWKSWSSSYKNRMIKIGKGGNQILQDSGRLKRSFFPTNVRQTNVGPVWFNPAKTKSGFPYAAAHDEGGPKLQQREFMWLSEDASEKISEQTLQYMIEKGI